MTTAIIFAILGGMLLLSIILSSFAYKRQQALSLKKTQINQLSRSISDLDETFNTLLKIDTSYDLILILQQQLISLIEKKLFLEPNNERTQQQLEQQKINKIKFHNNERDNEVSKIMDSDEAINLANFQLLQTTKLLQKFKLNKKLSPAKFSELTNHIARLRLDIEVESHIAQADRFSASNDIVLTQSHLKQARESLRAFAGDFPEKAQLIRSLTARIKDINQTNNTDSHEGSVSTPLETTENTTDTELKTEDNADQEVKPN